MDKHMIEIQREMSLEVIILSEKNWQILIREDLMVELVFSNKYPKDVPKLMIIVGDQFEG